jgi:MOSC domain-containing protein YiiM
MLFRRDDASRRGARLVGTRVRVGGSLVLEITCECDPCERMDALHPGLRAALTPDWRGGFCSRVVEEGEIAVGDAVRIL